MSNKSAVVIICAAILVASVLVWLVVSGKIRVDIKLPQTSQERCEGAGGLFFDGGFGADNCVFPPKEES